jgi:sulfur-carrier protein
VTITVKFFAILRDKAGVAELKVDLANDATVAIAADVIGEKVPALRDHLPRIAYAVNREYAPAQTPLHDGDELALIPPVSGG